jgi:hypothetical protein
MCEIGIPAIRGTKFFPLIRSLGVRSKLSNVKTKIDNEKINLEIMRETEELKRLQERQVDGEVEKVEERVTRNVCSKSCSSGTRKKERNCNEFRESECN